MSRCPMVACPKYLVVTMKQALFVHVPLGAVNPEWPLLMWSQRSLSSSVNVLQSLLGKFVIDFFPRDPAQMTMSPV